MNDTDRYSKSKISTFTYGVPYRTVLQVRDNWGMSKYRVEVEDGKIKHTEVWVDDLNIFVTGASADGQKILQRTVGMIGVSAKL